MEFDPIKALESIALDLSFDSSCPAGNGSYTENKIKVEFGWAANKAGVTVTFFTSEHVCFCKDGPLSCDCEWEWFVNEDVYVETYFSRKKVEKLLKMSN